MFEHTVVSCRRRKFVQAAVVQAVTKLMPKISEQRALKLLTDEQVPINVIERVLSPLGCRRAMIYTRLPMPNLSMHFGWLRLTHATPDQTLAAIWLGQAHLLQHKDG